MAWQIRASIMGAAALLVPSTAGQAQTVNSSNYRQYATCVEWFTNGRWFHSFGEGRCPPGSRKYRDPNQQSMAQTQGIVNAIGGMQQSLLALGRSITRNLQVASEKRAATYAYHFPIETSPNASDQLYATRQFHFPLAGNVIYAKVGDPILVSSEGFFAECFMPLIGGEAKQIGGHRHIVQPEGVACKLKAKDRGYMPNYDNYHSQMGAMSMGQALEYKDGLHRVCYRYLGANSMCIKDVRSDQLVQGTGVVQLRQTVKDVATFSAFENGRLTLQIDGGAGQGAGSKMFDVEEGKTLEVDGVTFEVLMATEQEIVFKRRS